MKNFEFNIDIIPGKHHFPHRIAWSSFVDLNYPLEKYFDSLLYTSPEIKLPFVDGMKLKISFLLGQEMLSRQKVLGQYPEEPNFPPKEPPFNPRPEDPTIIPDDPVYDPPSENPHPIPPEVPVRPESSMMILYLELLLALLSYKALTKLRLIKA
jgi:hypothetical protein